MSIGSRRGSRKSSQSPRGSLIKKQVQVVAGDNAEDEEEYEYEYEYEEGEEEEDNADESENAEDSAEETARTGIASTRQPLPSASAKPAPGNAAPVTKQTQPVSSSSNSAQKGGVGDDNDV